MPSSSAVLAAAESAMLRNGICDVPGINVNPVCVGGDAVGGIAGGVAGGVFREIGEAVAGAVTEILEAVLGFLSAPISPDVQENWLATSFDRMLMASATFAGLFFVFGVAQAILHSSPRELCRVVTYTIAAFAGSGVALALTQAFIVLVDVATAQVAAGTPRDIKETFVGLTQPLGILAGGSPGQALLAALLGMFVGLAALAVYLELFVRNVMIHVVVYFLPLMLIATIWGPTRRWGKRGIEFLAVLILSKFVLFAVIALGWSAIASFDDAALSTSWASVLTGFVLVAVAAWMPWLLFKLLPFMEVHVRGAMNRHDARRGMTAPLSSATAPLRTLEGNLRRAAGVAALVKGGPIAAALVSGGGGRGGGGSGGMPMGGRSPLSVTAPGAGGRTAVGAGAGSASQPRQLESVPQQTPAPPTNRQGVQRGDNR